MQGGGIGGFNPFGLLGEDNAQFAAKNAAKQAQGQAGLLTGYGVQNQQMYQDLMNRALAQSGPAQAGYQQLGNLGTFNANLYQADMPALLQNMAAYGLLPALPGAQGTTQTGTAGQTAAGQQGLMTQGQKAAGRTPARTITPNLASGRGTAPAGVNAGTAQRTQRDPGAGPGAYPGATPVPDPGAGTAAQAVAGGTGQAASQPDVYGLTQPMQVQLNAQMDAYAQAENAAVADYNQQYLARGQTPPPEGLARIREHYQAQSVQTQANFAEQARATREQASQALASLMQGIGSAGAGEIGQAASGQESLANMLGGFGLGAGGLGTQQLGGALNASQQAYQIQQQQSQQQDALLASLLGLAGFGLGGGFKNLSLGNLFGGGGGGGIDPSIFG